MNSLLIHKVSEEDNLDVWLWRTDAVTKLMSSNTDNIPLESHKIWFLSALQDQNIFFYIGKIEDQKIGVCRFNVSSDKKFAAVSIQLNPKKRGQKLSVALLNLCIELFTLEYAKCITLEAKVRVENAASLKCFLKCKFSIQNNLHGFYTLTLERNSNVKP